MDDNFVVSPLALEAILGLVRCGSRDETAQEIKTALSFPQNPKDIESVIKTLNPILKQGKNFLYFASNRIYIERKCSIKKEFKTIANEVYEIELEHIDFVNAARRTQTINNWVKTETAHKIADFLTTADVDGSSKMILISATYFTVNWLKFFQRDASSRGVFKISPTRSVDVNFMEKTGIYNYCESTDLKAKIVEMPLENKILELVMVLPNEINGLAFIESRLNAAFVDPKYKEERVNVIMPKVSFDFKLDLRKVFQHVRFHFSLGKRDTVSCSWGSRRPSTRRATSAESPPKNRSSSSTISYTRASSVSATKLLT